MVYKWYILPIGGLYATYHLLGEPETTIDQKMVHHLWRFSLESILDLGYDFSRVNNAVWTSNEDRDFLQRFGGEVYEEFPVPMTYHPWIYGIFTYV